MNNNDNSGVNTILIVVLIIIAVAALVWFFVGSNSATPEADQNSDFQVDVSLPEGSGDDTDSSGDTPAE